MTAAVEGRLRPGHPGRPPRAERHARLEERRAGLLDAAMHAIEAEGPRVSMTRIAAEAGVTKPVLYRYFGDRAGLYEAIASRFSGDLLAALAAALAPGGRPDASPRARLERAIDTYFAHLEAHPGVYRFLTTRLPAEDRSGQQLVTGFMHRVAADIARGLGEQLRAAGLDSGGAELLGHGITGMVHQAGEAWLLNRSMPRRRAVRYLADVLWSGLTGAESLRLPH